MKEGEMNHEHVHEAVSKNKDDELLIVPPDKQALLRWQEHVRKHPQPLADSEKREYGAALVNALGRRYAAERTSFDCYTIYHPDQKAVLEQVKTLAARIPELVTNGENVIFYGPCGTGKDHLLAALLHQTYRYPALFVSAQELFGAIRDRMTNSQDEQPYLRRLEAPAILGISDLLPPARDPSAWNLECLYRVLDRRYRDLKCTWVTFNADSVEEANEALTAPVFDRLRDNATILPCFWQSYRKQRQGA
jgi:DNA replication protein DnaC